MRADEPAPLPRRVSRYDTVQAGAVAEPAPPALPGGRVRRRSRQRARRLPSAAAAGPGATLRTGADDAAQQTARQAPRPADADAVRSALEEFEAAVEQAHRDSDTLTGLRAPDGDHPHDRNHLPKGAEQ